MRVVFSAGPSPKSYVRPRGSFAMRGLQIAAMRDGWSAEWEAGCWPEKADVFVMVKKADPRARGARVVAYDVVDPWPQKEGNNLGESVTSVGEARAWFQSHIDRVVQAVGRAPDIYIFPNAAMWKDMRRIARRSCHVIYHHYDPTFAINPVRREARVLGYAGNRHFIGEWAEMLPRVAAKFGMEFRRVKEPAEADILVLVRGGPHRNFLTTRYKSNVKLANCYGTGTPAVCWPESSYEETAVDGVRFFTDEESLCEAIEQLVPYEERVRVHEEFLAAAPRYSLENVARKYELIFREYLKRCA